MPRISSSIYFFGGTNELLVKTEAQQHADKLVPPKDREFGLEIVNGSANNTDEALTVLRRLREAIDTLPFLGGNKVVWLKSTNLLGDSPTTRTEATAEALSELADSLKRGLPDGVTLLISATEVDKRRSLFKTIEKSGEVKLLDLPDFEKGGREEIAKFTETKLKEEGKAIHPDALAIFVELVGANPRACEHEVTKLVLYTGDRKEINAQDVEAVVSATAEFDTFKLVNAIGRRDAAAAMDVLDKLFAQRESAIGILALTAWNMRHALLCRDLMQRRSLTVTNNVWDFRKQWERLPASDTAHFPRNKTGGPPSPFALHRCALAAKNFTERELIAAMRILLEAYRAIVTSGLDDRIVLEEAILKIITGGKRVAPPERQGVGT